MESTQSTLYTPGGFCIMEARAVQAAETRVPGTPSQIKRQLKHPGLTTNNAYL